MTIDRATLAAAAQVCACFHLRRASRAVTRLFDAMLAPGGLRSGSFVTLVLLEAHGRSSLPALARDLGVDRSTLTRNLKPLVHDKLVRLTTLPTTRTTQADITARGRRALERCVPLWRAAQARFEAAMGAERWAAMRGHLGALDGLDAEA